MAKCLSQEKAFPWSIPWYLFPWYKEHKHKKFHTFGNPDQPYILEKGEALPEVTIAYETYGQLNAQRDNVILVLHALTGDSHVASHGEGDSEKGWWDELVGPGRPIDTNKYFVVCSNVLGGCQGTTGPSSINPETGKPYGGEFPFITIRDMVRVQHALLQHMHVYHLAAVVGGSMGGMQALEWAVTYPDYMDDCIVIAAPGKSSPQSMAYNLVGRQAIMNDSHWQQGHYYHTQGPIAGLGLARMLGMITYQSDYAMDVKFGRELNAGNGKFQIHNYLYYQADKIVERFDANSYLYLSQALDTYDLGDGYASYQEALSRIQCRVLVVGVSSDILYPTCQQRELVDTLISLGCKAKYIEIDSPHGHDGFVIDFPVLDRLLRHYLGNWTHCLPGHKKNVISLIGKQEKCLSMANIGAKVSVWGVL
jgi:homoserine O-acetyltransferase/O-succinyltransferase